MKLKALIIEDESNSREISRNYLAKYCFNTILVGEAASIQRGGLKLIDVNTLDLVFGRGNTFRKCL